MSEQQDPLSPDPVVTPPSARTPQSVGAEAALFDAAQTAATKSLGANDAREVKEFAAAALAFAQAIVILDPALVAPQGVPPEVIKRTMPSPAEPQPTDSQAART